MYICYCDKCGSAIKKVECKVELHVPIESGFHILHNGADWNYPPKDSFDLCGACASELWDFLNRKPEP